MKEGTYISMDCKTTGLMPGARLTELAGIIFNVNGVVDKFSALVNPSMPIPEAVTCINGITDEMVKDAADADDVLTQFFDWLADDGFYSLIAHNAKFDTGIITWEAGRFDIEIPKILTVIDTVEIAKEIKETKNNKLTTLADHYKFKSKGKNHRALTDADLCMQYFRKIKKIGYEENPVPFDEAGHNYQYTDDFPEMLKDFPNRVENALPVTFSYVDAKNEKTERSIIPHGWALQNGELFINGQCLLRDAPRTFKVDCIENVIN